MFVSFVDEGRLIKNTVKTNLIIDTKEFFEKNSHSFILIFRKKNPIVINHFFQILNFQKLLHCDS